MEKKLKKPGGAAIAEFYSKYGILLLLVISIIVGSIIAPNFLSVDNLMSVANQVSVIAVLCCGMSMIIITGNADLSAGSGVALASVICAVTMKSTSSIPVAIVATILAGMVFGAINGFFVSYRGLPAFIITLASQMALRGTAYIVADGAPVLGLGGLEQIAKGKLFGVVPLLPVFVILSGAVIWYVLSNTVWGRYLYAIGGNREAAAASGINVKRNIFQVYIAMGAITAFAGILYAGRTNSGLPAGATAYEFDAIIGCVLGGCSMAGGVGNVVAAICGALVVQIINNCMNLCGVNSYYQQIVKGLIIVIAIIIDKTTRDKIMKS